MPAGVTPNAKTIEACRLRAALTWGELAERANVCSHTRTRMRQGRPVSLTILRRVAEVLGVRVQRIVQSRPAKSAAGTPDCADGGAVEVLDTTCGR
jgi:hypothetical protein